MLFEEYHFHLYFSALQVSQAHELVNLIKENFSFPIGRIWDKPVGPHPVLTCQVSVTRGHFEAFVSWLMIHRNGIDVFIHALTDNDLKDHSDYIMWIGKSYELKLDIFRK